MQQMKTKKPTLDHPDVIHAWKQAVESHGNAYSPYSKFSVGSCLKVKGKERYFSGCNVENSSFGATVCAERNAVFGMVNELGRQEIDFIVLVANTEAKLVPCGLCLQVLSEFADLDTPVFIGSTEKLFEQQTFQQFLPQAFTEF
jgi:cytidine deaminase